jgi:hypothetical protein
MRVSSSVGCRAFPCEDVRPECYQIPGVELDPTQVTLVMVSEAAPPDPADYYYASGTPLFQETTVQAFLDAGVGVDSVQDILDMGVYLTTAVKCGKTGYGLKAATVKECSLILEEELSLFPNIRAFLLMGDVAIKAANYIARRSGAGRAIPAGATYKIRGGEFYFRGCRAFPSYLQAGPSFLIERSKRRMIAEDIVAAVRVMREDEE